MNQKTIAFFLAVCMIVFLSISIYAQGEKAEYVGAAKCKMCHNSKKSGMQFTIWEGSTHSKAFATLASEEAKAVGQKLGIADPQKSENCLSCHTTGGGKVAVVASEGIGCESCHGPGSAYKSMKIMKDISAGKEDGTKYGMLKSDEAQCKTCHNEKSPTFKGFDYQAYWDKIKHPVPAN
jgi:hypothetical protein